MLADHQIHDAVTGDGAYSIGMSGFDPEHLNPASYDLTLSPVIRASTGLKGILDVAAIEPGYTRVLEMGENGMVLFPGEFILAATNEVVTIPQDLAARVEGKSSLGRIGLAVHITAGFIDPGFHGSITLEIVNLLGRPIRLRPNMRIAQIAFIRMAARPFRGYEKTGHYQHQGTGLVSEPVESCFKMAARVPL